MELIDLAAAFYGVARVVPALGTDDNVRPGRQNVNDFPFSFIAPLNADYHSCWHTRTSLSEMNKKIFC